MRITWWGHATTTIEANGTRLLTDPVLTSRIAHLRRRRGPAPPPEAGQCDAVLVSHMHADHLHLTSLPLVAPDAALVVPRGAAKLIHAGQRRRRSRTAASRLPRATRCGSARSTSPRSPPITTAAGCRGRRTRGPALGYRVEGSPSVWFAGDTDLYDDLAAEAGPVDLALIPVGGWGPSLGSGTPGSGRARRKRFGGSVPGWRSRSTSGRSGRSGATG